MFKSLYESISYGIHFFAVNGKEENARSDTALYGICFLRCCCSLAFMFCFLLPVGFDTHVRQYLEAGGIV